MSDDKKCLRSDGNTKYSCHKQKGPLSGETGARVMAELSESKTKKSAGRAPFSAAAAVTESNPAPSKPFPGGSKAGCGGGLDHYQ